MKIPLSFQVSEYDCGTTTFINALSYLYDREEIPVDLLKRIYKYTLDVADGYGGTSRDASKKLANYFIKYANKNDFGLHSELLEKEKVTKTKIQECIKNKGVVVARCYQEYEHYVLITNIDNNYACIFDPYYLNKDYYINDKSVSIVTNKNFAYNRIVKIKRLFGGSKKDFSLMEKEKRQVVLINRINK